MRGVVLCLMVSASVAWVAGCAETGVACDPDDERFVEGNCLPRPTPCDEEAVTKTVAVGCTLNFDLTTVVPYGAVAYFPWELSVEALDPIRSGEPFRVLLLGVAKFDVVNLNIALVIFNEFGFPGFRRLAITDFQATVRVRKGADGPDVPMELADLPKACTEDPMEQPTTECATDDECPGDENRCLPVVDFKTSGDEEVCQELGLTEAFNAVGFCITEADGPAIRAKILLPEYTAHETGSVLFGWADTTADGKHPTVIPSGANRGAFDIGDMMVEDASIRVNGMRVLFLPGPPIQFECSMGTNSRSADGTGTVDPLLSPSPDGALISCPIEPD